MGWLKDFVSNPLTIVNPYLSAGKKAGEAALDGILPKPPEDNSAALLRQQEEQRQAQIRAGTGKVNEAFARFDDPYYDGIAKAYMDYYRPMLDEQFGEAKRTLTLSSPSAGSSAFARSMGLLSRDYARENTAIADRAQQDAAQARGEIEGQRSSLLSSVLAGTGVDEAGSMAVARARSASAPRPYSPLADVFSRALSSAANVSRATTAGFQPSSSPLLFGSGGSNVRTVG